MNQYNKNLASLFCELSPQVKDMKIPDSVPLLNICLEVEFDSKNENGIIKNLIYVPDKVYDCCEDEKEIKCFSAYLQIFMKEKWNKLKEDSIDPHYGKLVNLKFEAEVLRLFDEACEQSC